MNRPLDISRALQSVDLAREPDFRIGSLRIFPSQRQIMAEGRRTTLQPRAMRVLVALARADGAVVSREQLIERCWDGIVVGDDAINSSINKVRQVSDFGGIRHFEVETISRVGYRLHVPGANEEQIAVAAEATAGHSGSSVSAPSAERHSWVRRYRAAVLGTTIVVASVAIILLARTGWSTSKDIGIAVNASGAPIAGSLATELKSAGGARGGLAFSEDSGNSAAEFVLDVAVQRSGQSTQADVVLTEGTSKDLLWSSTLTASDTLLVSQRTAYVALGAIDCAIDASSDIRKLDRSRLRLLFSACDRAENAGVGPAEIAGDDLTIALWRKVVQSDPGNARALAMLGFSEASSADASEPDSPPVVTRRRIAKAHLQTALVMDPAIGIAYAAEAQLLSRWRYRDRLDLLNRGIANDPDCALLLDGKARLMSDIGKVEAAVDIARRAVALAPASTVIRSDLISALAYAGYTATAASELKDAERIWPDSLAIAEVRSRFDFRFGDPKKLMRAMDAGNAIPNLPMSWQNVARYQLRARAEPTPANISAAIEMTERLAPDNDPQGWVQALVVLGAVEKAYRLIESPRAISLLRHRATEVLFRSYMRPFLLDRRFPNLAAKLGLLQFWESSGLWPNICDDPQLPYNCRWEAQRLHAHPSRRV